MPSVIKLVKEKDFVLVEPGSPAESIWRGKGFVAEEEAPAVPVPAPEICPPEEEAFGTARKSRRKPS